MIVTTTSTKGKSTKYKVKTGIKAKEKQLQVTSNRNIIILKPRQLNPSISVRNVGLSNPVIQNLTLHKGLKGSVLMSLLHVLSADADNSMPETSHIGRPPSIHTPLPSSTEFVSRSAPSAPSELSSSALSPA